MTRRATSLVLAFILLLLAITSAYQVASADAFVIKHPKLKMSVAKITKNKVKVKVSYGKVLINHTPILTISYKNCKPACFPPTQRTVVPLISKDSNYVFTYVPRSSAHTLVLTLQESPFILPGVHYQTVPSRLKVTLGG